MTTSSLFQVLNRAYYEVRERSVILVLDAVVYRTEFRQQPSNLQQNRAWAVVSPLGPRSLDRAGVDTRVPRGVLVLGELRAAPIRSEWAGALQRGRGAGGEVARKCGLGC